MARIKGYFLRVDEDAVYKGYTEEINDSLECLENYVGGTIQNIRICSYPSLFMVINDDGIQLELPLNRFFIIPNPEQKRIFPIYGNIVVFRCDEYGIFHSIKKEDITYIERCLPAPDKDRTRLLSEEEFAIWKR